MIRRAFLAHGLMLIGFGRPLDFSRGRPLDFSRGRQAPVRYARLTAPVRIPLEALTAPWQPVSFKAEAVAPPARRVLLTGVVFRRAAAGQTQNLSAVCVTCTHEQCQVDFVAEPANLPRTDRVITHPVFLCACHSSVFDAVDEGAWVAGPAPRGLYRFRLRVGADAVEIDAVEEEALFAV